ncbi:MFS transporter [Acidaminobacter sp. JC074]|uniref:MFS transporter n=1 Tax=Acidaminobacter sp. JC074 TaxID=2530199 RepID=UPI001F0DD4DB|nr:MFS transporter [Acidaminobacter sp. JC074]
MELWKRNLWILWTTQVISLMSFGFGLPFLPLYIIEDLGVTSEAQVNLWTSILAAAPAITMGIMAPIWGKLSDQYGRKLMILRAMFSAVIVIGLMGAVSNVYQLLTLRLLQGLLTGTVTAAAAFVGSNTPRDHLTDALGVISSSTFIGYSLGPMIGGLFAKFFGYRMSFYLGGAIMLIGALMVTFLISEDKSTLKKKTEEKVSLFKSYGNVLIPTVIAALITLFFLRISRTIFSPYLALFVKKFVAPENVSSVTGLLTGLVGFSTAFASMNIGKITRRFDKFKVLPTLVLSGVVVMAMLTQYDKLAALLGVNGLVLFSIIYMLFFVIVGGIEPIVTSTSAMSVDASERGALFGLQGMVGSMAWAAAPAIAAPIVYSNPIETVLYVVPIVMMIIFIASIKLKKSVSNTEEKEMAL